MSESFHLAGNRVLVLGRAGMDLYPDPPGVSIVDAKKFVAALGGSSGNIAAGIAWLGGRVSMLGCVSDDAIGRYTLRELGAYGVNADHMRIVGGDARNTLALSESRVEGHETVVYRNGAADFEFELSQLENVDFEDFDAVVATGTSLTKQPSRDTTFEAFKRARAAGAKVFFDIDYRPYNWASAEEAAEVYSRAAELSDVIIGNDVEFGFMAGGFDKGREKAKALATDTGKITVYKMGGDGAVTFSRNDTVATGVYKVDALKPIGAGDSFMAGFVTGLAEGLSLHDAVLRGSACAAIVVTKVGCAPAMPTPAELADFIASHPGPTIPQE